MSEASSNAAGVTILAFCQLNGRTVHVEISADTYAELRATAFLSGKTIGDILEKAFTQYGVSESAILQYISDCQKGTLMVGLEPTMPIPVCFVCNQPVETLVLKECSNCRRGIMICSKECADELQECPRCVHLF